MQAMRQSQEPPIDLQDIVLEANAACDSWEGEARRRAKYVADLEVSRLARGKSPQNVTPPTRSSVPFLVSPLEEEFDH